MTIEVDLHQKIWHLLEREKMV